MCDQYGKVNLGTVDLNEIVIGSAVTSSLQMHLLNTSHSIHFVGDGGGGGSARFLNGQ